MTIEIREARLDEAEVVHHTIRAAFAEYEGKLNPPSGALRETPQDLIANMEQGGGSVLAWEEDTALGSATYRFSDPYMYIGRVAVCPGARGKGVCKLMLRYLEEKARLQEVFEARVGVRLSIPANIAMYQRLGYETIEHQFYPDRTDSWYVMSKKL
ncbi:GNAT family N-acetyltransferase [Paenibacillus sp. GCM10023248]|uniref:GNAT family N-acetyltransferase n=1 Tax=unclassified Paenibacillus TaxID=185978 RepID=UPI002379DE4B|nr:GNAT family N-acetyltransferase [Paenibacillus sp. MAHUQ-63]MDD9270425.1 GNAT family N-acetyltransferase [Paenibacillus sp. MAHUQ-63]